MTQKPAYFESNGLAHANHVRYWGVVAHWLMNENAGLTVYDVSGEMNHGTLTNGPTWAMGMFGSGAIDVDGVNQFMDAGSGASLDNLAQITVSAWIKPDNTDAVAESIFRKRGAAGGWNIDTSSTGTGRLLWFIDFSTTDLIRRSVSNVLTAGVWHHVVGTWKGGTAQTDAEIYVNGVEVAYASGQDGVGTRVDDAANSFTIGASITGTSAWGGQIDDVRIYNRHFSSGQVRSLYFDPFLEWTELDNPEGELWETTATGRIFKLAGRGGGLAGPSSGLAG